MNDHVRKREAKMLSKKEQAVEAALLEQSKKQKVQNNLDKIKDDIDRSKLKVRFQEDSDLEDVAEEEGSSDEEQEGSSEEEGDEEAEEESASD